MKPIVANAPRPINFIEAFPQRRGEYRLRYQKRNPYDRN
jgi:hypothetical protein